MLICNFLFKLSVTLVQIICTEDGRCICRNMFVKLKSVVFFLKTVSSLLKKKNYFNRFISRLYLTRVNLCAFYYGTKLVHGIFPLNYTYLL